MGLEEDESAEGLEEPCYADEYRTYRQEYKKTSRQTDYTDHCVSYAIIKNIF